MMRLPSYRISVMLVLATMLLVVVVNTWQPIGFLGQLTLVVFTGAWLAFMARSWQEMRRCWREIWMAWGELCEMGKARAR